MLANDYFDNMKQPMSTWKLARPWWGCLVWPTASRKCPRWTRRVFSQGCGRSWARVELDNPSPQRVAKETCCLHSFMPENSHHIMMIFTQNHLIFHSDSPSRYTALSAVAAFGSVLALASLWVMVEGGGIYILGIVLRLLRKRLVNLLLDGLHPRFLLLGDSKL